jgi:hypothetical protein
LPVNGARNLTFKFYTTSACTGSPVQTILKNAVSVTDGLFAVALDVNANHFNGQGLWLAVETGSVTIGCQEILPVPYALSLRPGALIQGTGASAEFVTTKLMGSPPTPFSVGVFGESVWGVYGHSPQNIGVYGISDGTVGNGVIGYATSTSGTPNGVYGRSQAPDGYGGYFVNTATEGSAIGLKAESDSGTAVYAIGEDIGVQGYGYSPAGTGGTVGVQGLTNASAGNGVWGFAQSTNGGHGVYAQSKGSGGTGAALWAQADHASGIAIWGKNTSNDSTLVLENYGSGDLIKAFIPAGELRFRVNNAGNVYADGTYSSPASDFAELLPAAQGLEPGEVLVIGPDGKLARSTEAFQATVAGVYSTQPGFVGGVEEKGAAADEVPLAVVGVVPVKVSAENGPVQPGDLLVSASTPGHAMKAGPNPPVGTVIGKALQPLDQGVGTILLLVMLQ